MSLGHTGTGHLCNLVYMFTAADQPAWRGTVTGHRRLGAELAFLMAKAFGKGVLLSPQSSTACTLWLALLANNKISEGVDTC